MSQVRNLLDMFVNDRKDVQAKSAKAPESKGRPAGAQGDLLPLDSAGKEAAPKSFQAKIKESRAKLAAKAGNQAAQKRTPDIGPGHEAPRNEEGGRTERAERTGNGRSARPERAERPDQPRPKTPVSRQADQAADGDADRAAAPDGSEDASRTARVRPQKAADACRTDGEADVPDEAAAQELKAGLESIGLRISDEQLQDPAFLRDLLQMLQALPLRPDAGPDSVGQEAADTEAVDGLTMDAAADAAPADVAPAFTAEAPASLETLIAAAFPELAAQPAGGGTEAGTDPEAAATADLPADGSGTAPAEARPADRKSLVSLIRNRIEEMSSDPAQTARNRADASATPAAPTTTPQGWQGVKVRPRTESVTTQPLPMADFDRLRVLQAAALQAGNAGKEIEAAPLAQAGEENGSVDAVGETGNTLSAADRNAGTGAGSDDGPSDRQADLFGGNGEASRNAETSGRKEGPLAPRETGAGPQFQANLEQARSVDHRSGVQRAWEPRPAFEPSALEQIAKKMSAIGHKSGEEISIQLSPEHLGKVRVSLEMKEGGMSARIAVESDNVKQQVEAGISALKDALENQGIKLQGLEVSVDQRHGSLFNPDGSNAESFFHRNGRGGQGGTERGAEVAPFESAPESDTGRRWGYNTMEYIG
ncbi:MAG TPA: flagellar hook-length control protein FliK [Fibrobacteria bacterium]|nr:flagellar hook-length control protein FliK [Fibrobacteria bacterium]